jgi:hypothetical protein
MQTMSSSNYALIFFPLGINQVVKNIMPIHHKYHTFCIITNVYFYIGFYYWNFNENK